MKSGIKESMSRILLIVFTVMLLISLTFLCAAGGRVILWGCFGFLPMLVLMLGVEKHRKYACAGFVVILLLMMADHIAGQKRNDIQMGSCFKKVGELGKKLDQYESQAEKIPTEASNNDTK